MSVSRISIIVPVYNTEKYLRPCLDSILAQTFSDFEVVLVDDGSKDQSGAICDEYAQKDVRFHVIHKQNGGVSSARNIGIEMACGEWFYFCDSDDILYKNALETFTCAIKDDIDSICCGYEEVDDNNNALKYSSSQKYACIIEREEALIDFYKPFIGNSFNGYLWNRLLRSEIIRHNGLRFREDIFIKEDGLFLTQFLCHSKRKHYYLSKPVYKYRINQTGAMASFDSRFNRKSLSNLYARIECYKAIKEVSDNSKLLKCSKDSISEKYLYLISIILKKQQRSLLHIITISYRTFYFVSPLYIFNWRFKKYFK